jgi:hypothetical protein
MAHPLTPEALKKYEKQIDRPLKIVRAIDSLLVLDNPTLRPIAWYKADGNFSCYMVGVFGENAIGVQYILGISMSDPETEWEDRYNEAMAFLAEKWPERSGLD